MPTMEDNYQPKANASELSKDLQAEITAIKVSRTTKRKGRGSQPYDAQRVAYDPKRIAGETKARIKTDVYQNAGIRKDEPLPRYLREPRPTISKSSVKRRQVRNANYRNRQIEADRVAIQDLRDRKDLDLERYRAARIAKIQAFRAKTQ